MKTIFTVSFIAFAITLSSNELAWVDKQIDSIKPPREGVSSSTITSLSDPFIFLKKQVPANTNNAALSSNSSVLTSDVKAAAPILQLTAVMNDSALINGEWYKIGDTVHGYKLLAISMKSVKLTSKKTKLTLTTHSDSKNLKFKNK